MSKHGLDITGRDDNHRDMAESRPTFPLRFHDRRLRELVREVAERERVSQNDLIETAVENEVVARGAMLAEDLAAAAERLGQLTASQTERLIDRSVQEYAQGEGGTEPLRVHAMHTLGSADDASASGSHPLRDQLGVLDAFSSGRR